VGIRVRSQVQQQMALTVQLKTEGPSLGEAGFNAGQHGQAERDGLVPPARRRRAGKTVH
jgi:hypothetical protein